MGGGKSCFKDCLQQTKMYVKSALQDTEPTQKPASQLIFFVITAAYALFDT